MLNTLQKDQLTPYHQIQNQNHTTIKSVLSAMPKRIAYKLATNWVYWIFDTFPFTHHI